MKDFEWLEIESGEQLRRWLAENHERSEGLWLVHYKQHVVDKHVSWDEIVDEALCWGWIDSRARRVDEDRTAQALTPRRKGSRWSALNKQRVEALTADGRMMPAGLAAIERAKADGSWSAYDDVDALLIPEDLAAALAAEGEARAHFDGFSDSSKKALLWWIASAKRQETRRKRIVETARQAAKGVRVNY